MKHDIEFNDLVKLAFEVIRLEFEKQTGYKVESINTIKFNIQPVPNQSQNQNTVKSNRTFSGPIALNIDEHTEIETFAGLCCHNTAKGMVCTPCPI